MKIKHTKRFSIALVLALSLTLAAAMPTLADGTEFTDVAEDAWYADEVAWAIEANITEGVGDNRFDPEGEVNRAQIVTFLWRMAGRPEPTNTETFADVESGSWYETAVQWAVEQGITNGTGSNQFSPFVACDRAMCVTLLYRLMGSTWDAADAVELVDELGEDATMEDWSNQFTKGMIEGIRENGILLDVPQKSYYELAVMWGAVNGILTEDNTDIAEEEGITFRPTEPCIRSEMVSFLYQAKLLEDAANAPLPYEYGSITIPFPREYDDLLYRIVYATGDSEDGMILTVSERASVEAAEAMGLEPDDGVGELFSIERISEETLHEMLCEDMSGAEVFAKDENNKYYVFRHPTDVRYVRETNEQMAAEQAQWDELNRWARNMVRSDIIQYSDGLTSVTFSNTPVDMLLARAAWQEGTKYTISTTEEYGTVEPEHASIDNYVNYLLEGNFALAEEAQAPSGQYVALRFPEEDVRYDFFSAEPDLVREIRGETETFYERVYHDADISNYEAMQGWYYFIAELAGVKPLDESLKPYVGIWYEKIAGRGEIEISWSVAPKKADIAVRWPDSAFAAHTWKITASMNDKGELVYENGVHTLTEYDEDGSSRVISETTDESGTFALNDAGELIWSSPSTDRESDSTFVHS